MEVKTVTEDDKGNVNFSEDLLDLDSMYVTNFVKSESKYLEDEYEITRSEEYKEKERLSDDRYRMHMSGEKYGMSEKEKRNKIKLMKMLQKLLEVETVKPMTQTYYFVWETLFLNFLKMDENYTPFLDPNKTWTCFNDSSNRDQANEDIKNLDNLITTLASYGPEILNKNIINKCTSITQFFKQICDFYGMEYTGLDEMINQQMEPIHPQERDLLSQNPLSIELMTQPERVPKVAYSKFRKSFRHSGNRNYQEFYLELRTTKYEDLMGDDSGIKFNGLNIDEDEKMISGIENEIVIDWLEGIDRRLPDFIEQKYSSELKTISLYNLQGQISQNLDSHISEIEEKVDGAFQIQFGADNFEHESEANGIKGEMETEIFDIIDFADDSNKLKHVSKLGDEEWGLISVDFNKTKQNISSNSKIKLNPKIEAEEMIVAEYSCETCGKCFQQTDLLIRHKKEIHTADISLQSQISEVEKKGDGTFQIEFRPDNFDYQSEANGIEDEVKTKNGIFDIINFTDISINSKPKLNVKNETEEMIKAGYSCEKCGKCFQQTDLLIRHKKEIHTGDIKYTCDHCDLAYKSGIILRIHVKATHEKSIEKSFKDESSEKSFQDESSETLFKDESSEKSFIDKSSKKSFTDEKNLENYTVIHTGKRPFKCDECDKSFKQKYALKMHKKLHSGIAEYICDICSRQFYELSKLVSHKAVHSERTFPCDRCGKSFKRHSDVIKHSQVVHNGERRLKLEKKHTCEQCGKSFMSKKILVEHIRVHTGERPFLCEVCNKSFAKEVNLNVHKRLHTKQFPFKCDMCNSAKNELIQLKKHKLIAHGIKYKDSNLV